MVHKRYVERGGKLYGPYFYETFRDENGNVKNLYYGNKPPEKKNKKARATTAVALLILGILLVFLLFNALEIAGLTTKQGTTTNLTILDNTELNNYYSNKSSLASTIAFTANYTEITAWSSITGNCTISFNTEGAFTEPFQMAYNQTSFMGSYRYNYSFDRRGTFQFNVSCNSTSYETLSVIDYFTIQNSYPVVTAYPGDLPSQTCTEDTACTYNFSTNVTDYDLNDIPLANFSILNAFSCISINVTAGIVKVNCTEDLQTGTFSNGAAPSYIVYDGAGGSETKKQNWVVTPVNDAPQFNTTNWNVTATEGVFFSYDIDAWDEENGSYPNLHYSINATCPGPTCGWLNLSSINSTTGNISFLASNSEVGFYHINVTVNDSTGLTTSNDLQINVANMNDAPNLTIACSPNLTVITTEDNYFECWINATDIDSGEAANFTANYTWLALNSSSISVEGGKAGVRLNLTPTDSQVGYWWVNFTVTDRGNLKDSAVVNFTILNVEEWPFFTNIANFSAYASVPFRYDVNASDNDSSTQQGDTIKFTDNSTLFEININTGVIDFTPTNASAGTHWINITVNDSTDRGASIVINFTINPNTAPILIVEGNYSITEGINYYTNLSLNFTDTEGDSFNFTDNSTLFNIQPYGNLTINATEVDVGTHWVIVNATDAHGAVGTYTLNFTIYNVNQAPLLFNITGVNTSEGSALNFNISANDSDLLNPNNNENLTFRFNYTWIQFTKANATTARVAFTIGADRAGYYWVNATVNDTGGNEASYVFYMNITESADYPKFTYVCNNELTQTEDTNVLCRINATDLDAGAQLNFTANYTWFLLNGSRITVDESSIASSLVNFTPTYQQVGNWSINISVSDGVYINTTILHMNVSSVNDRPNITTRDVITGYTLHTIRYDVNATDEEDGNDAAWGTTTTNLTLTANDSRFTLGSDGRLEFTPNLTQNGTYWVNVTVNDTQGYGFSYVFNVTVIRNSAPTCSVFLRGGVPTTPPDRFGMNENESTGQFVVSCSDTEGDTIQYDWFWHGRLNQSSTVTSGWNYTTTFADSGDRNITLIATDLTDNSTYYWNVTVNNTNVGPQMHKNIPNITSGWFQNTDQSILLTEYFYDHDNDTISYEWHYYEINESFDTLDSEWSVTQGTWNVSNNVTNYFYNQSSTSGETLAVYNETRANMTSLAVKIRAYGNKTAGVCIRAQGNNCSDSYRIYFNGSTSKLIFEIRQGGSAALKNSSIDVTAPDNAWNWLKIRAVGDSIAVYYSNNSLNYTLAYNITNNTYRSGKVVLFTENTRADFDDVVLKTPDTANFTISLNTNTSNLTFSPATGFYGEQQLQITASDGNLSTDSNTFYLTIFYATPGVETVTTTTTTAGATSLRTQTASLDIIVPAMITLDVMTTTLVPVILNNSGDVALNILNLEAFTNATGLKLTLDNTNWNILEPGKQVNAMLTVEAGLLTPQQYVIELIGTSQNPKLRETAKISIDVREREAALKTQLKENIAFTRDLFLQNPECLELSEMLDRAEDLYDEGKYQEGLDLVKTANEGCKDFIAQERKPEKIVAAKRFLEENWKIIAAEAAGAIVFVLLMIYYLRRRKFRKTPKFE